MKADNCMKLEFPSKSANESFARGAVACFMAQLDPTIEELEDVKTAVSEAVTNCTIHGYPNVLGKIHIRCRILEGNELEIVVRDTGCGIPDIERAREPMFTTGGADRSGMGFSIMESFMDKLKVRSAVGRGTTVTMRKKLSRKNADG